MGKEDAQIAFGVAGAIIAVGGLVFYFLGARPRAGLIAQEVIPVDEPTIFDWAAAGGSMYLV